MGVGVFFYTGYFFDDDNYENDVLYIGNYLIIAKETLSGDYVIEEGCVSIADYAFSGCDSLTGITVPDTVIRIGDYAFYDCGNLVSVNIPDSVISIGNSLFEKCVKLEKLKISKNVKNIGDLAFFQCVSLKSIKLPDSVTNIGYGAFALCSGLTDIVIPDNVTSLGDAAFAYCDNLTEATIGSGITEISYGAFGYCTNLVTVTIKGSITNIGGYAFSDCNSLKTVRYNGTKEDWSYITVDEYNDPLIKATIICMDDNHECEYGEWVVTLEPTATTDGEKIHTCVECGKVETVIISATDFESTDDIIINFATNTISGFNAGEVSLDSYITTVNDNYVWEYETSNGKLGTGSKAILKDGDTVIGEYTILVYGDTTGDSWYDGQDAIIVDCLANGMLTKDDVSEAVYMAADCNHDGVIDQLDVELLNQAGMLLTNVDQTKPAEVLLETSVEYVEYIDLIDQSPEIEDETDTPEADVETEDTIPEQGAKVDIFEMIMNFIKSIFEMLLSYIPMPLK